MYGLVLKALADLARAEAGERVWSQVCVDVGTEESFVGTRAYPDELIYELVAAVGDRLGLPPEEVLRRLGHRWIRYTSQEGWGPLIASLGGDLTQALLRLDELHLRVGLVLPHLQPPSFEVLEVTEQGLRLGYRSPREGLAPMVVGLVEEMGRLYGTPVVVRCEPRAAGSGPETFVVRYADAGVGRPSGPPA